MKLSLEEGIKQLSFNAEAVIMEDYQVDQKILKNTADSENT